MCMLNCFNHVQLFLSLWTVTYQAPLSLDAPGKDAEVGCHALLQGNLPGSEIKQVFLKSPALARGFFTTSPTWEAPKVWIHQLKVSSNSLSTFSPSTDFSSCGLALLSLQHQTHLDHYHRLNAVFPTPTPPPPPAANFIYWKHNARYYGIRK